MIGAIILAAGYSRRFGDDKRRATLANGNLVIQQTLEKAGEVFDDVRLILRREDDEMRALLEPRFPDVTCFHAPDSALGMGHSLANAATRIDDWDGAFVFLADMPFVNTATLARLKSALTRTNIVVPTCNTRPGHPVGFPAGLFDELKRLEGDRGARAIIDAHKDRVLYLAVEDQGVLLDVDLPTDLWKL